MAGTRVRGTMCGHTSSRRRGQNRAKAIPAGKMAEDFSELMKDINPQIQASERMQCRMNEKKSILGDIIVKQHNPKEEAILKWDFVLIRCVQMTDTEERL